MTVTPLLILRNLVTSERYHRAVIPYLKLEYFDKDAKVKAVLGIIIEFSNKYNTLPTKDALLVEIQNVTNLKETDYQGATALIDDLFVECESVDPQWLLDITESFCQEQAIYLAINKSIDIIDGSAKDDNKQAIPQILQDALGVTFDGSIGLDYLEDALLRYKFYHDPEDKIPFDLDLMNKITKNGFSKKTLNLFLGGTNVGKTLVMCHLAAHYMTVGANVLYITMEMGENQIGERIDQNLLNVTQDDLREMTQDSYLKRLSNYKAKVTGKLFVKQYPTGGAGSTHFKHLLGELKIKKRFIPDVIVVDYINICSTGRVKDVGNLYVHAKAVAEELRGIAVEHNAIVISATQTNRGGQTKTDLELSDVSDSAGMGMTADWFGAVISSDELEEMGQYRIKQLKSRYNNKSKLKSFVIGVDKEHMKLFNVVDFDNPVTSSPKGLPYSPNKNRSKLTQQNDDDAIIDVPWYDSDECDKPFNSDVEPIDFTKIKIAMKPGFDIDKPHGGLNTSNLTI